MIPVPGRSSARVLKNHQPSTIKNPMLTTAHQKFCEGIVSGMSRTAAYSAAFPRAQKATAQTSGSKLFRKPCIQAEITRLRGEAERIAGPAILSHIEIRAFLTRIVRWKPGESGDRADLGGSGKLADNDHAISTRDKLLAIKLAINLAPKPEPEQDAELAAFHEMIRRVRTKPWRPCEIATALPAPSDSSDQSDKSDHPAAETIPPEACHPR
jgi:hypothetical protein